MRLALVAVVVFGLSAVVTAQSRSPRSTGFDPLRAFGLPLPQIGLPLPSIGLPLSPLGLPDPHLEPAPGLGFDRSRRRFDQGAGQRGERDDQRGEQGGQRGRGRSGATFLYYVPFYGWPYLEAPAAPAAPQEQKPRAGRLRLEVQRGVIAQIYIDGFFVGMLDDSTGDLTLDAGPHHVELRADGYESLEVDVLVPADRSITFRGALKPVGATPTPVPQGPPSPDVPPPPAPATIYMIPGCYVGNVLPQDAGLPTGCDARRAITFEPRR